MEILTYLWGKNIDNKEKVHKNTCTMFNVVIINS